MKFNRMSKKGFSMPLQFFAESGDDGQGAGEGDDDPEGDNPENGGEEDSEEKKFSQKEVDETVKKRLAREKRKWQREQQKPEKEAEIEKHAADPSGGTGESEADKKARKAEEKAAALEMKWTCLEHDVKKDCVDDVLALARVHMGRDDEADIEDAIDAVLKKYPQFKDGYEESGGEDEQEKKGWGQRHGSPQKKESTVEDEIRKQMFGK